MITIISICLDTYSDFFFFRIPVSFLYTFFKKNTKILNSQLTHFCSNIQQTPGKSLFTASFGYVICHLYLMALRGKKL